VNGDPTLGPFTSAEGGCLSFRFFSDGSFTDSGWEADVTLSGCVDPPPGAVVTFCVDVTCLGDLTAVSVFGNNILEGFVSFPGQPLTETTANIFCGDIFLPPGPTEYQFVVNNNTQETLTPNSGCTLTTGQFTNRLIEVEDGVPQMVTFAWESCEMEPDCGEPVLTDITFCVDLTCEAETPGFAAQGIEATFNNFNSGTSAPLSDPNGDNIWCVTESLEAGDVRFGFFYAGQEGAGGSEDLTNLPCATDGAGGWKRTYTVVEGLPAIVTYAWESCEEFADCDLPGATVTFCVDVSCLDAATDVSVFGNNLPGGFAVLPGSTSLTETSSRYLLRRHLPAAWPYRISVRSGQRPGISSRTI
jgi:hypothetical protein